MKFELERGDWLEQTCDLLVLATVSAGTSGATEEEALLPVRGDVKKLNSALHGLLSDAIRDERFHGKQGEVLVVHTQHILPTTRVALVGMGTSQNLTLEHLREAAARAACEAQRVNAKTLRFVICVSTSFSPSDIGKCVAEGALLASYHFSKYQPKKEKELMTRTVERFIMTLHTASQRAAMHKGVVSGQQAAQATTFARNLVNEPALVMKPRVLVEEARAIAKKFGLPCEVLNEAAAQKLGMGAFLGVARGSDEEGYLIHLTYTPGRKRKNVKRIVLCGKGITFDSGGLSLKPGGAMMDMKSDMAAAAALLGLFTIIDDLAPQWEVHAVIAATENMPSGKAIKPGDVVAAYNGKTIEILNTDAEGRLVLADALSWANATIKPDVIVDLATLTGAAIVALGQQVAALFGTDKAWVARFQRASEIAGERVWEMPLVDEYRKMLDSHIADIQNISRARVGDTIIGALFLREFVGTTPWLHLDIAGPAWVDKPEKPYIPYGASGFGVRTLIALLKDLK